MAGDTIKEYLVALGFDVDDASLKKFNSAIAETVGPVVKLGAAVTATAITVEVMVERVAHQMQDLFYASQRTGVAAQTLQAVGYAAKQLGLNAGEGADLMESFSRSMRVNPGMQAFLSRLGGEFQTVNGQVGLTDRGLNNVLDTLAKMPRYQALLYAGVLGVNPDALNTILNNLSTFKQKASDAAAMADKFGLDLKGASDKGNKFMQGVGELTLALEDLSIKASVDWMPWADKVIKGLSGGVQAFGEWVGKGHEGILMLGSLAIAIGGVGGALKALGAIPTLGWIGTLGSLLLRFAGVVGAAWTLYETLHPSETNTGEDDYMKAHPENYPGAGGGQKTFAKGDFAGIVDFFKKAGWSEAQAIGIATNLNEESSLNPGAKGDGGRALGIGQWHADRQKAFKEFTGHDIRGSTLGQQLAFVQHELTGTEKGAGDALAKATNAKQAAEIFSLQYERPGGGYAEATRRGNIAGNVTLNQKTEISVNGSKDPVATGKAVGDAQAGVNNSLARNFGPKVQ